MKRLIAHCMAIFALIVLLSVSCNAYDSAWGLIHGLDSDCLLIGRVIDITEDNIELDVIRTVNGKSAYPQFNLSRRSSRLTFAARVIDELFIKIGDTIMVQADFTDFWRKNGQLGGSIFKVELMNDKKIKMGKDYNPYIEWYVNTGDNRLVSDDNNLLNGKNEVIYLGESQTWAKDSLDAQYTAPEVRNYFTGIMVAFIQQNSIFCLCVVFVGLVALRIVYIVRKKRKI